jgi:hypothetical protein
MHEVDLATPGGLYIGRGGAIRWDAQEHDQMIQRITRGLYFHHHGEPLPPGVSVDAQLYLDTQLCYGLVGSVSPPWTYTSTQSLLRSRW